MSKIDFSDIELYDGQTFDSLLKQIHDNSNNKKQQIDSLIDQLSKFVKDVNDATLLVPLLSDYLNVSIKNDDQLIKLATIVQRFLKDTSTNSESNNGTLTQEEKDQLRSAAKDLLTDAKVVQMGK